MTCTHQSMQGKQRLCSLGMYGGKPYLGNCLRCAHLGQNNAEYAAELFAKVDTTHPSNRPRLSGCCGSALNT